MLSASAKTAQYLLAMEKTFFAETLEGPVRMTCEQDAVTSLVFIDKLPARLKPCDEPPALRKALRAKRVGGGSALRPQGSSFQLEVWNALLTIPHGKTTSYGALAGYMGRPRHARAVGGAIGANEISLLIPCHRVLTATGKIGGFRWGASRKEHLLQHENSGKEVKSFLLSFYN